MASSRELSECEGAPAKKPRAAAAVGLVVPGCQVDGCNTDLTNAKDYHRRHKVCVVHSKAAIGIVGGLKQRFCQQCSRFHSLAEFDEGKRSCRKRLAGHNERRRKPQPDPLLMYSPFLKDGTERLPFATSSLWFSREDEVKFNSENENWQGGGKSEGQFMINFSSESSWMVGGGGGQQLFLPNLLSQKVKNNGYDNKPLSNVFAPSQTVLGQTNCHPPFSNCSRSSSTLSFSGGAEMHSGSELPLLPSTTRASDIACALSLQHPCQASDIAKDWFPQPNSSKSNSNSNSNSNNNNSSTLDPSLLLLVHQNSQDGLIFPSESPLSSHSNHEGSFMHGQMALRNPGISSFPPLQVEGMGGGGYRMNDIAGDDGSPTLIDLMRLSSHHLHSSEPGRAFCLESSTMALISCQIGGELQALHYEPTLLDSWPMI